MPFSTLETRDCPICNFNCTKLIHVQIVDEYTYLHSLCKICGFVFQQRRYERSHYEALPYQTQEDYDDHSKRRASYILRFCGEFLFDTSLLISPKILDIGCGRGGVMKNIKTLMPLASVTGYTLDMGETQATDLKILYRNIEDLHALDFTTTAKHDLIIMSHVVEHFYDLRKAMDNVRQLLAIDGLLYIEVPSFHWCEVRMPSVRAPEHLSYFTKRSLTNLLTKHGFKILKIKDSRYWGNIKVVATIENRWDDVEIKPESGWWTMTKHHLAKSLQSYYRLKTKIVKPGSNE